MLMVRKLRYPVQKGFLLGSGHKWLPTLTQQGAGLCLSVVQWRTRLGMVTSRYRRSYAGSPVILRYQDSTALRKNATPPWRCIIAEADWATLTGTALSSGDVIRGVTNAFTAPTPGVGATVFGFHAITTQTGVAGYYTDLSLFNPIDGTLKCGSIRAAMKKYSAGGTYAPFIGFLIGTDPATAQAYTLALSEGTSFNIVLKKGYPGNGFSVVSATDTTTLRSSTAAYTYVGDSIDYWFHLRLDVLVNPHGEVVISVFASDLDVHLVTTPSWTAIAGMDDYIDDSLGVLSGSAPYLTGFYPTFGHYTSALAGSVSLFDQLEVHRQLTP